MTRQGQILAIAALVFIFFNHVNGRGLDRSRRSADNLTEAIVLTNAEISSIVSLHNNLREQQSATNMKRLTWDADLATFAQNHLSTCPDGHSSGTAGGFSSIGENIGTSRTSSTTYDRTFITTVTQSWYDEVRLCKATSKNKLKSSNV
uniref:cysteine-rich secretory protein LCCL domain-containing 1-like n=1 Tax=Ciona intestinalis TaxID=7719 RepID=UPI000EF487B6|nr:cysteine-rich secretory protein LCCL domain-containing 1-like [Ciona intestinalis]|eukprot:XP_026695380.1 cysteine-rich secretory protein LCCL domain-containing 1-like [Ciona intestinalis]